MTPRDDITDRAEARVGQVLKGKWRLDSVLGIGGMATVYAATHRNRARVAIKMLHSEVAVSQDVTTRFLREGYVGNAVAHSGSVRVLDDDVTEDGAPFLVMELLEGESLGARLDREGQLPAAEVAQLAFQLLDVLAAAHAAHIVHRDLKPDNVFLTFEGRVKVLDFGIARLRAAAHESSASTQVGSLLGTPAFMAPEQALGRWKDVDERTDIWAVGATLFTLLSGRFVFEAEAVQEQLVLAATSKAPSLLTCAPGAPHWLARVVDKALSFSREERFADARSMQAALRDNAVGIEFVSYPQSAQGAAGQFPSTAQTPPGMRSSPSIPRPVSSPSFGEGATVVAADVNTPAPRQSPGTFESVQAVARSANEAAQPPRSKLASVVLALLGFAALVGVAALVWFARRPPEVQSGVTLAGAAALPPAKTLHLDPQPEVTAKKETPTAKEPAPPASASTRVAANLPKTPSTAKTPPTFPVLPLPQLPPIAKPHGTNQPERRENLFDNRH